MEFYPGESSYSRRRRYIKKNPEVGAASGWFYLLMFIATIAAFCATLG